MMTQDGIIDRIEENVAVIILKDGQKLTWPMAIGNELHEGQAIRIILDNGEELSNKKEQLARDVLNEILNQD